MIEVNSEGARVATALAGKVCCTVAQPQDRPLLESAAFHELFDFSKLQGVKNAQGVIAVQRTYATANKATVQAFLASVSSAITAEKQDKARLADAHQETPRPGQGLRLRHADTL